MTGSGGDKKVTRRNSLTDKDEDPKMYGNAKTTDFEAVMEKIPYPKAVFFIIVCEFCERFCYYGMRAVLTLYFKNALKWDEDFSTVIYHVWVMFCYFTPLFGAMLADSVLGKFRTIFYLSVVYCCGSIVLSLAATPPLHIPTVAFSMIGLALIAIGTGGIKPCVSAFGGDQFKIPGQEKHLESYFAIFYFSINSGSLITQILTPIFREDVSCFGDDSCFPLAFSVPAALMIIALIIFLLGRPMYKIVQPEGNVVIEVVKAVAHSFSRKGKEVKAGRKRDHWLDYADDRFDQRFLDEAKVVFKVLFLYIPLPIFWTLYDQQGSRWTFQATRMNGKISGSFGIKADQMQVINPILVLMFIPIFDRIIYPLLAKCNLLKKPLQRLTVGLLFAGLSFVTTGLIELTLVPTYAIELASGQSNFQIVNALPCDITISQVEKSIDLRTIGINEMAMYEAISSDTYTLTVDKSQAAECANIAGFGQMQPVTLESQIAKTFIFAAENGTVVFRESSENDDLKKAENGDPKFRLEYFGLEPFQNILFLLENNKRSNRFTGSENKTVTGTIIKELEPDKYNLYMSHSGAVDGLVFSDDEIELKFGGSYVATVVRKDGTTGDKLDDYVVGFHELTSPNSVHMLWQLPQFIIMTAGEIMFSITIMDFSYTESPPSMKSVMQGAWLLTVAVGNLIVVIIAEIKLFEEQWKEFFLFAGIMFGDLIIFSYMAYIYKPTDKFWLRDGDKKIEGAKRGRDNEGFDKKN